MAITKISGAYAISDTTTMATFVDTYAGNSVSGSVVFVIPAGGNKVFLGVTKY